MEAAGDYVRLLIRRPHAYWFLEATYGESGGLGTAEPSGARTGSGERLPLPGLYVLEPVPEGAEPRGRCPITSVDQVVAFLRGAGAPGAGDGGDQARVTLRVRGFVQAAGIT